MTRAGSPSRLPAEEVRASRSSVIFLGARRGASVCPGDFADALKAHAAARGVKRESVASADRMGVLIFKSVGSLKGIIPGRLAPGLQMTLSQRATVMPSPSPGISLIKRGGRAVFNQTDGKALTGFASERTALRFSRLPFAWRRNRIAPADKTLFS
jgi:hypothetical protein